MTAVTTSVAVTTHSRVLVLTAVRFVFDDTSFMFEDSLKSTWASYSDYFVSLMDTRQAHLAFMFP